MFPPRPSSTNTNSNPNNLVPHPSPSPVGIISPSPHPHPNSSSHTLKALRRASVVAENAGNHNHHGNNNHNHSGNDNGDMQMQQEPRTGPTQGSGVSENGIGLSNGSTDPTAGEFRTPSKPLSSTSQSHSLQPEPKSTNSTPARRRSPSPTPGPIKVTPSKPLSNNTSSVTSTPVSNSGVTVPNYGSSSQGLVERISPSRVAFHNSNPNSSSTSGGGSGAFISAPGLMARATSPTHERFSSGSGSEGPFGHGHGHGSGLGKAGTGSGAGAADGVGISSATITSTLGMGLDTRNVGVGGRVDIPGGLLPGFGGSADAGGTAISSGNGNGSGSGFHDPPSLSDIHGRGKRGSGSYSDDPYADPASPSQSQLSSHPNHSSHNDHKYTPPNSTSNTPVTTHGGGRNLASYLNLSLNEKSSRPLTGAPSGPGSGMGGSSGGSVSGQQKFTDSAAYWLALYFVFNLGLTLFNKLMLVNFPFPYTLTGMHALSGCAGCYFALERGAFVPARLTSKENMIMAAFSVLYTINIAVSNLSLHLVTVPFHQVVRASTPLFTIVISILFFRGKFTLMKLVSLLPVIAGVGFATYGDYYFTAWGLILTLLGTFLAAMKTVVTNVIQTGGGGRLKLHPLDLLMRMSPLAFIQCVIYGWWTGELGRVRRYGAREMTREKAIALLFNGIIAFGLNVVSFSANKKTGALTMTVAANCKQVLTIAIAVFLFNLKINFTNGIGIVLTLIGGAWYGWIEFQEGQKKRLGRIVKGP